MAKREHAVAEADNDAGVRRAKRRKEGSGSSAPVEDVEMSDAEDHTEPNGINSDNLTKEAVKDHGLRVWQMVKDAVGKDGHILSPDFLRLPSKRQYPDYYNLIKRPIALDDIKKELEAESYSTLEEVRHDFDTCFKNAKKYNMRESQIWKDAKFLQKLAGKEFDKIIGPDDDDDNEGDGSDDGGTKKKKSKGPNMTRLLKSRMQKLIGKQDENGRTLSDVFMELPSRKKWPIYYKTIKRPICLEDIFRKIRRKEYETVADCIADVDLVFANALQFNEDHTQIWEDAVILRDYFHKLMQDLPPPFGASNPDAGIAANKPSTGLNRIVLKVPVKSSVTKDTATPATNLTTSATASTITSALADKSNAATLSPTITKAKIKSPMLAPAAVASTSKVATPAATSASATPVARQPSPPKPTQSAPKVPSTPKQQNAQMPQAPVHTQTASTSQAQQQPKGLVAPAPTTASSSSSFNYNNYQNAPNYVSAQSSSTPAPANRSSASAQSTATTSRSQVAAFTPPPRNDSWPIRFARLATQPLGRKLELNLNEGVRCWAMRLADGERKIILSQLQFVFEGGDGEDESEEEKEGGEKVAVDEDAAAKEAAPAAPKRGRRGRKKATAVLTPPAPAKEKEKELINGKQKAKTDSSIPKQPPPAEDILVKFDGSQVKLDSEKSEEWSIEVSVGNHIIELGHKAGMTWKVYIDRRL